MKIKLLHCLVKTLINLFVVCVNTTCVYVVQTFLFLLYNNKNKILYVFSHLALPKLPDLIKPIEIVNLLLLLPFMILKYRWLCRLSKQQITTGLSSLKELHFVELADDHFVT